MYPLMMIPSFFSEGQNLPEKEGLSITLLFPNRMNFFTFRDGNHFFAKNLFTLLAFSFLNQAVFFMQSLLFYRTSQHPEYLDSL